MRCFKLGGLVRIILIRILINQKSITFTFGVLYHELLSLTWLGRIVRQWRRLVKVISISREIFVNLPFFAARPSRNPLSRRLPQETLSFVSCEGEIRHAAVDRWMFHTFRSWRCCSAVVFSLIHRFPPRLFLFRARLTSAAGQHPSLLAAFIPF